MNNTTRVLIVEDNLNDYNIAQFEIRKVVQGCTFQRVEKQNDFLEALRAFQPHIILSDFKLPGFDGMKVLELAQQYIPSSPVIIWTGAMGEEMAVECMKSGASDYILKDNIRQLGHAVIQALKERDALFERKQAEEKYQAIFENSPVGIFQSTPQGRFISVNPAMARIYGYGTAQEMISSITDIAHQIYASSEDRREFTNLLETQHVIQNFEWKNTRKDGSILWTATSARAVYDETGTISYYEGFLQDITDRKLAESGLRESETRYHSIFENAQDAIFVESLEGDILEVNQRACEIFGYTRQEFLQKKVADILPAEGQSVYSPLDNSMIGQTVEAVNVRANGEHFPVELRGGWYEFGGRRLVLIVLRDITERKQADEKLREQDKRFRVLIENGMDSISLLSADGALLWENPANYRTLGYETNQFLDQNMFQLMHPDDLESTRALFAKLVQEFGNVQHASFRLKHHEGTWRWVEATATNMLDEPSVKAIVVNYRDVTERKQAEEALRTSEAKYRMLAENSLQGIAIFQKHRLVYVNPAMCTIMGFAAEELLEMSAEEILALTHPDDRAVARERTTKHQTGESVSALNDVRIIRKDGSIRWIQTSVNEIDYEGQPAILSTSMDITERKQAETELQQKNTDLELLNSINEAVVRGQDLDWIVQMLADELKRIFSTVGSTIYMLSSDQRSITMQQYSFSGDTAARLEKLLGFKIPHIQIPLKEGGHFHRALISKQSAITSSPNEIRAWIEEFAETQFLPPIAKLAVRKLIPHIYKLLNIKSTIIVPLIFEEEILGFLDVSGSRVFTQDELKRIEKIAGQLTSVIQRQRTNEKIRESEERFRLLFENSGEAVLVTQADGTVSAANPEACRLFERSEDEIRNLGRAAIADVNDPRLAVALQERARTGQFKGELRLLRKDGSTFAADVSTTLFRDSAGSEKTSMIIRDMTERIHAEKELRQSEQRYHALFDDMPLAIWENDCSELKAHLTSLQRQGVTDFQTYFESHPGAIAECADKIRILGVNNAALQMYEANTKEELIASTNQETTEGEQAHYHEVFIAIAAGRTSGSWEGAEQTLKGRPIEISLNWSVVPGYEDDYARVIVTTVDITERKQAQDAVHKSEALYRQAIEVAGAVPYYETYYDEGRSIKYDFIGEGIRQITGYGPEEFNAKLWDSLVEEVNLVEDLAGYSLEEGILRVRTGKNSIWKCEHRLRAHDGKIHWVFEAAVELRDQNGVAYGSIGTYQDITERKQAEAAEREQRILAEALRDTSQILSSSLDYGEVLDHILNAVGRVVPHDAATIMLIDGGVAHVVRSQGYQERDPNVDVMQVRLPVAETANLRQMLETKQPIVVDDTFSFPGWNRSVTTAWQRSNVGAPISIRGDVIGFILLDSETPGFFTPVHAERLEAFANQAALAIQNADLLKQAQDEIAERKRAEASLQAEREKVQNYLDIAGVIMLALDQQGTVTLINQKGCEILGYSAEEVIGRNWINTFVPEALREEMQLVFQQLISGNLESVDYYENTVLTRNGEERLIAWHNTLVHDIQGEIISTLSSGEDITERKRAEQDLRASEERFRQLATNIEEAFWMTDARTGQELYISPAAAGIWGHLVDEMVANPDAFINSVLPDDKTHVLLALEKQRNGEKTEIEYRVQHSDGTIHWVWDRAFPVFDENGTVKTLAGIAADITARKLAQMELERSQARYQDLFDSSPVSLWEEDYSLVKEKIEIIQKQGVTNLPEYFSAHPQAIIELASLVRVVDVNQASMELYHARQKDELLKSLSEFISEHTIKHFLSEIQGLMSAAKFEWEGPDTTLDGREIIVVVNGSIPPGHEKDWSKVIVTITDITERKRAEEKLRASEERYHSLFQHLVDGFALHEIITDEQGKPVDYRFLEINPAFETLTGLRAEATIGRRVNEILPRVGNERFISVYGKVALTGEPVHFEEYSAPLGRYYEIHAYSPRHGQFAVTFADITERKEAEEELRKLSRAVEQSASTIVITDMAGNIEYVNPKFTEITGYSYEEAIGQNPRILKTGHTPHEEYKQLWTTISAGGEWRGELYNRKKNGDLFWEQATISPIQNEQGEITHFIAVKEDITQRKQNETEIQRHIMELQAVYENGLAVGQLLEPRQIGERLIETFARHLSWHHVTIRLLRPETEELRLIAFNLPDINSVNKAEVERHFNELIHKAGQGMSGWVAQTGVSVRTGRVHEHSQYISTQAGIESGLYMPVKIGNRVIGVISVESEKTDAFSEQDERLLATLATQAAIAFENARLYQAAQQEIAERERAEAALRTSETHYRELADSITEIMFELDQNLHYIHWNKASEMFSGISAENAIGQSMLDVFGESEEQSAREKIYRSVLTEQQAQTFETEVFPRGQRRILEINAYPSARGVSVVARDITERRLSEALQQKRIGLLEYSGHHTLEELMQRAIDEVSELTDSHIGFLHFVETDQKTINMQAWSSETLQGMSRIEESEMHYPLDSAGVWADAVRRREPVIHNDYESLPEKKGLPDRHVPVIRELVVPIVRDDKVAGVLGIGNKHSPYDEHDVETTERFADYAWDIIERKKMESALSDERNQLAERVDERTADLSRANSNLARALRVKDEFLANMSHELRTPLNAILGLSESLSEQVAGPLNEKQQKYLTTINESGHHLLSLINDILDLAKIEAGQITLDINKVDVNSVCQASLRMIKQLAQKKNQEVLFEIDKGLGLMWADERRLKQMIVNLLSNAVKFTPESGKLGLEVHGDQGGNRVLITVWDRGIGINNQDLNRLFRPFVQLDSGLAREATGTGLGLALVAEMARLHGGSVNVDSQIGEGSRFTIQLPWEPALATEASSRLRTSGKFRAIDIHAKNKPTILLIEDTREVVMMLADYLEMAGFIIATAQDGIDGLEQAKLTHPDLILMDIQMPRMDGFETSQKLRLMAEFKETPIIALTALAMPNDRQRCLDAGMSEYISKPVNLKMLLKVIRGILYDREGMPK